VQAVDSNQSSTQRRRSERIIQSVPLIVRGIDLLGQPFEERTSTLALNLHGCRYASKHHLPKNTWVTLEIPQGTERRNVRARVAWIQRPHSVREFFQIAVELESAANIWGIEPVPADWENLPRALPESPATSQPAADILMERMAPKMNNTPFHFDSTASASLGTESMPSDSPLLREWKEEIERQANRAAENAATQANERIRQAMGELEKAQVGAGEAFSAQAVAQQNRMLEELRAEFEKVLAPARTMVQELERKTEALRAENDAAAGAASRMAQARLQLEAAELARSKQEAGPSQEALATEETAKDWRQRLNSEMEIAQAQWNELLQSSLDSNVERLVERLSGRSQEFLRSAEQEISNRFSDLREPLGRISADARQALSGLKSALEQEISRARTSLAEIEQSAGRMKEYSAQLEAASQDTLNELHRRLESILEAQTEEMRRRVENLSAGVHERLGPALDSVSNELVERTTADVESRLAPRIERVSELVNELAAREGQIEESLRLHRERLRQVSENSQREAAAQMASTVTDLRSDFESARKEALGKWSEELDAVGARASHAAAESLGRSSEWFQQEARARLQVLIEQALATAEGSLNEKAIEAARNFGARMDEQMSQQIAEVRNRLDGAASELTNRTRSEIAAAAEAAAASFGHVLSGISEREAQQFADRARGSAAEQEQQFARFTQDAMRNLESNSAMSLDRFHAQMASHVDAAVADGQKSLAAELAALLDGYRAERVAHQNEWAASLSRLSDEASGKFEDRLQTSSDSWMVSSVRRLNEHGQNTIESLMRSADQALRESCSKVFEGLAEMFRNRPVSPGGVVGFVPPANREAEAPVPHQQSATSGSNA